MLPPDATPISTEQLLQKIGELTILNSVLQERLRLIQAKMEEERKEAIDNIPFSEPVRVPQRPPANERI